MTLCVPLLCVPLLDVITTWTLNLALCRWGLAEPVLALWLLSLLRVGLLAVLLQACSLSRSELPAWLQPQELSWMLLISGLLTPAYVSLTAAAGLPSAEMLYGLHNWSALALNYASTGLVFLLRWHILPPSSEGQPVGEAGSKATLSRLLACMKPNIGHFLLVALFLVLSSLGEMAIPYYTGRMTDWVMNEEDPSAFTNSIIAMSLITSASALTEFICDCVYNVTMTRIHTRIQSSVFRSVVKQKICFFDTEHTGDITSRITTDTNTMSESLTEKLSLLMWYLMRAFFLLVFMVKLSFKLTLFSIIGMFIISIVPKYTGKYYQELRALLRTLMAGHEEAVGGLRQARRNVCPHFQNVSFELKCGEITALVGPSGGGKTTCVNLLERFYQPQSGQILLDGRPIEEYEHKYYHNKVALVSQEPVLFARSVERNIAYGLDQQPLPSTLEEAATRADAHHFIITLQEQYKTGEQGDWHLSFSAYLTPTPPSVSLSLILSVYLTNRCLSPPQVLQSVYNGNGQHAVLVIAHRLSTIERADRIVVLEAGTVVEEGTHQELRENGGCYQRLLQKHFQGFGKITEEEEPEPLKN
ncbi:antigen peptide transporter 1 [Chiloscyllium plagiosum]|uniref:antigen peptide transporter 1 n=1 Tax=Chiloscyllium plagiosum TaxID=36176 RepID=UPI001CB8691F|nr:antigen peptide transporter 1 [Chiloscyllium plagiosum]